MSRSEITPYLLVGTQQESLRTAALRAEGVSHIVNVQEAFRQDDSGLTRLHFPLSDFGDSDLVGVGRQVTEVVTEVGASGGKVFLHCRQGQNRSPSIATIYMMLRYAMDLRTAFFHVRERRPEFAPHEGYFIQLQELEVERYGACSLDETEEPLTIQSITRSILAED